MNEKEHKERHEELHEMLEELLANFICHTGILLSKITLMEFLEWSAKQRTNPTKS